MVQVVIEKHGGILLHFAQQFPGAAVPGEHPGKFHVKGFKRSQVQQQTPDRRPETLVHRRLEVVEQLPPDFPVHTLPVMPPALHLPAKYSQRQRIPLAGLHHGGQLRRRRPHPVPRQQLLRCLLVQHQVLRLENVHPRFILEGHQPTRRPVPPQQNEVYLRIFPDGGQQRLLRIGVLQLLQIVHQRRFTVGYRFRRSCVHGVPAADGVRFQQYRGRRSLPKAARRTEKNDLPLLPGPLEFLPQSGCDDNPLFHASTFLRFPLPSFHPPGIYGAPRSVDAFIPVLLHYNTL